MSVIYAERTQTQVCIADVLAQLLMVAGAAKHSFNLLPKLVDSKTGKITEEYDNVMLALHMLVAVTNMAEKTLYRYYPTFLIYILFNWFFSYNKTRVNKLASISLKLQRLLVTKTVGDVLDAEQQELIRKQYKELGHTL